jgi:hypothetical protein
MHQHIDSTMDSGDLICDRTNRIKIAHVGNACENVKALRTKALSGGLHLLWGSTDEVESCAQFTKLLCSSQADPRSEASQHHNSTIQHRQWMITPFFEMAPSAEPKPTPTRRNGDLHRDIAERRKC